MGAALLFGTIGSSALVLGSLVGGWVQIPKRVLAAMLAFASGALITALAFELFEDSYEQGGLWRAGIGLLVVVGRSVGAGALTGLPRVGAVAVLAGVLGGGAGLLVSRALGSDPVPTGGVLAAVGTGVLAGVVVLVVAGAVMMVLARRPLLAAVAGLRAAADELFAEELFADVALENDPSPSRAHASWRGCAAPVATAGAPLEIRAGMLLRDTSAAGPRRVGGDRPHLGMTPGDLVRRGRGGGGQQHQALHPFGHGDRPLDRPHPTG